MSSFPTDALAAVTHANPYPYYADLVARQPLYHDVALGAWVASSAAAVTAVLTSDLCHVRPPAEVVPAALVGTPAGDVVRQMVRFNDGARHCPFKDAVSGALYALATPRMTACSGRWARDLADELEPTRDLSRLARFAFQLPLYSVASLLGVPDDLLPQTAAWAADFARCLAPGADAAQLAQGARAADALLALFHELAPGDTLLSADADNLLAMLAREAAQVGQVDVESVVANAIGFLFQSYDATAALLGNALLALATYPAVRGQVNANADLLQPLFEEVSRYDPPVQNTRRYVVRDGALAGQDVRAGDVILVVLAAASRDPSVNARPDEFDIARAERRTFGFGAGGHACPGPTLATTIARAGLARLLAAGVEPAQLLEPVTYRSSLNIRNPLAPVSVA